MITKYVNNVLIIAKEKEKMLKAKDYRNLAWADLSGKWGTMALISLINALIIGACGALSYVYIGGVASLLITGPLTLGLTIVSLNVARHMNVEVGNMFEGFKRFGDAFVAYILISVFTFLWSLLLIIPGIIKAYSYSMTYYIMADNPAMSANDARKLSMQLMRGNKWRLFCLLFSFIGWWLLCCLTLGILALWIDPYRNTATAEFYKSILPATDTQEEEQQQIDITAE